MAIDFIEGFDQFSATLLPSSTYTVSGSPSSSATTPFSVGASMWSVGGGDARVIMPLPSARATMNVGFHFRPSFIPGSVMLIAELRASVTNILTLWLRADGRLELTRGSTASTNVLLTSTQAIIAGQFAHIVLAVTRHASTGTAQFYLNGLSDAAQTTGLNTGASDIDTVVVGHTSQSIDFYYDNLYVTDSLTFLGEFRVDLILPITDDAKVFTPNSGTTNYTQVDEGRSDGDTTYVSGATAATKDRYTLNSLPTAPSSIAAVQPIYTARKDDATLRQTRANIVSNGTTDNGTTDTMSTAYKQYKGKVYTTDPSGGGAWTLARVNALKVEIEIVT